jgi:hypothetical protein
LIKHARYLLDGFSSHPSIDYKNNAIRCIILTVIGWAAILITYLCVHNFNNQPADWDAIMLAKCPKAHGLRDMWENKSVVDAGVFFIFPGAYLGVLFDSRYLGGSPTKVNYTPFWKSLLRFIVLAVCGGILILPQVFLKV